MDPRFCQLWKEQPDRIRRVEFGTKARELTSVVMHAIQTSKEEVFEVDVPGLEAFELV